jgi:non-specific serine/threonine protein kinase
MTLSEQMGDRANVAYCLEGLATVARTRGQVERSALLLGAAEGLLQAVGDPVYTYYKPDPSLYERTMPNTRLRLGAACFERVRAEGRAMTFEQAVEYALEDEEASSELAASWLERSAFVAITTIRPPPINGAPNT